MKIQLIYPESRAIEEWELLAWADKALRENVIGRAARDSADAIKLLTAAGLIVVQEGASS